MPRPYFTFEGDVGPSGIRVSPCVGVTAFPTIRGPVGGSVNSMQIAEIELVGITAP